MVNKGIGFKSPAEMGVGGETGRSGILVDAYHEGTCSTLRHE
eukprot:CAMPEP_0172514010 /NCGR_PEP_ID=MMETSP1066-20121228/257142_1 /TAXON_ID=671091 /ORGANISM="Coscinodiscus wailesii, Strain CCMP2513" /LENGTH=41 /DNA_ID= /DNA_START= /DNA_END= /DNA_ORIENTATION=